MSWLLAIAGFLLSLFLPGGSADVYWQGLAHGAAIVAGVWLGLHLMTKLKLKFVDLLIAAAGIFAAYSYQHGRSPSPPTPSPVRRPVIPWRQGVETFTAGGPVAPDSITEVECDLPRDYRQANTGGRDGAGLCVFTSIMHAARYQQDAKLWNFRSNMKRETGGGFIVLRFGVTPGMFCQRIRHRMCLRFTFRPGELTTAQNVCEPHVGFSKTGAISRINARLSALSESVGSQPTADTPLTTPCPTLLTHPQT